MTQFPASPAPHSTQRITRLTRRDIFDYLSGEGGPWWGRLDEIDFLGSLYDLDRLASTDSRFTTAREDIIQHRVNNPLDWSDDWVCEYPQFQLLDGPDEVLLAFLARFVHPAVQPDVDHSSQRVAKLNRLLGAGRLDPPRLQVHIGAAGLHASPRTGHRPASLTAAR